MPRVPRLDFLTFLVYFHHTSLRFSGSTLPTVGLSQGGLKAEVTVTQYACIRHVGPRPEWPRSSMESRDRAGALEDRPCPRTPTSAPAVPRACWCSVQNCCMKEATRESVLEHQAHQEGRDGGAFPPWVSVPEVRGIST